MKEILLAAVLLVPFSGQALAADKPNILWLTSEDHGPEMGCYGDKAARTPNIDALAAKGMRFRRAWSVAPVCAPARTTIISGIYPSSSGGIHMRSMVSLAAGQKMYPQLLREAGYYCTNNSKTDYNLREPGKVWDESSGKAHWKNRGEGQPFFAIFNSTKSHESQIRTRPHKQITRPADVRVPAYHPDTPEVRQDWAQYYDQVSAADADAGRRLRELEEAGFAADTIVFYYADHGSGMPRSKRWPCNSGLHVPLVVYFPEKWRHLAPKEYEPGSKSERMISFVDLAPTVLSLAGLKPPEWMQGHAFAGPHQGSPQSYLFGERGRMDERMDLVRSVTDGRYVYLRNFHPHVSQGQRVAYQFETPTTRVWHELFLQGKTNQAQSLFWRVPKAAEELYDLETDRDEVRNLAQSPEHRAVLEKLREALRQHLLEVRDVCFLPESELHTRSAGSSPYELARDSKRYPLERIIAAAELASSLDPAAGPKLNQLLSDDDSAVRYWGALGLLMRGENAVNQNSANLEEALADSSPAVRIVAAQALAEFGDKQVREKALAALGTLAVPKEQGVLVAMSALSAMEALGTKATSLHAQIARLDPKGPSPDGRYDSYVPRLVQNIVPDGKRAAAKRPNILFAIADDWGLHGGVYGTQWVKTPSLDRIARQGVLFRNAYTPMAKCAPSRAIVLTGRHLWQNEQAGNHMAVFPTKLKTWPEVLMERGWHMGFTGKGWGPGIANDAAGKLRMMTGKPYNKRKSPPPTTGIGNNDYAANFVDFLDAAPKGAPWCFWYGSTEPHREYEFQSGVKKGGKKLSDIDRVPAYWPDKETVRHDMLDYALEVEHADQHLGRMLAELERRGLLDQTLVIVTSDHGMPFPRVKGYAYHDSNHVPLAIRWPGGVNRPGRDIDDFVDFTDIAPTLLDYAGLTQADSGMLPITGRSWRPILESDKAGTVVPERDHVLIGKERTDVGRPHDWGYPIRGLVTATHLYLKNYEPARWPAGNPETGYLDTDGSPTKSLILELGRKNRADGFWRLNFGLRPAEELYDLREDAGCVHNLAAVSEQTTRLKAFRDRMESALTAQQDPRMLGNGRIFDEYQPTAGAGFYERYLRGEKPKAGWVNESDFEREPIEQP